MVTEQVKPCLRPDENGDFSSGNQASVTSVTGGEGVMVEAFLLLAAAAT
jgi:hypothetical protein